MVMQRITNSGKTVTGAISPDGRYVVHATLDGDARQCGCARSRPERTSGSSSADGFYFDMKISTDGNYVFYEYAPRTNPNVVDIFQIPILGGESRKIVDDVDGLFTLSPDGRRHRIPPLQRESTASRSSRQRGGRLDRDRSPQDKISAVCRRSPAWAPDGRHLTIVTGRKRHEQPPSISQLDIATGRIERVDAPPGPS